MLMPIVQSKDALQDHYAWERRASFSLASPNDAIPPVTGSKTLVISLITVIPLVLILLLILVAIR